ncbi:hypothetical protein [Ferrovibrio sp.]
MSLLLSFFWLPDWSASAYDAIENPEETARRIGMILPISGLHHHRW